MHHLTAAIRCGSPAQLPTRCVSSLARMRLHSKLPAVIAVPFLKQASSKASISVSNLPGARREGRVHAQRHAEGGTSPIAMPLCSPPPLGPQFPCRFLGRHVRYIANVAPASGTVGVFCSIMSYNDTFTMAASSGLPAITDELLERLVGAWMDDEITRIRRAVL